MDAIPLGLAERGSVTRSRVRFVNAFPFNPQPLAHPKLLRLAEPRSSIRHRFTIIGGEFQSAFHFIRFVAGHAVAEAGPLGVARVEFVVVQFTGVGAAPRFFGERAQHARPATLPIRVTLRVQTGEEIRDGRPRAYCAGYFTVGEAGNWIPGASFRTKSSASE
jgi:hypothetical protein